MEPGANAWHSCIHRLSVLSRRITGFTCACASRTCLWRSSARYGGFQEPVSPEGFRRMSRLIAYMGPVSGENHARQNISVDSGLRRPAFVAVLLGLYLLAARGIYRGENAPRVSVVAARNVALTFSPSQRGGGSGNRCALQAAGHACRLRPRGSGIPARRESRSTGGILSVREQAPGRLAPWNAF